METRRWALENYDDISEKVKMAVRQKEQLIEAVKKDLPTEEECSNKEKDLTVTSLDALIFQYFDGHDWVMMTSQEEFLEAVHVMNQCNEEVLTLRVAPAKIWEKMCGHHGKCHKKRGGWWKKRWAAMASAEHNEDSGDDSPEEDSNNNASGDEKIVEDTLATPQHVLSGMVPPPTASLFGAHHHHPHSLHPHHYHRHHQPRGMCPHPHMHRGSVPMVPPPVWEGKRGSHGNRCGRWMHHCKEEKQEIPMPGQPHRLWNKSPERRGGARRFGRWLREQQKAMEQAAEETQEKSADEQPIVDQEDQPIVDQEEHQIEENDSTSVDQKTDVQDQQDSLEQPALEQSSSDNSTKWHDGHSLLQSMGFTNWKLNEHMLNHNKGNVSNAVTSLLKLHQSRTSRLLGH
eukprot:CAMPEP_0117436116 /NCGR_PEP_ID=MMETSP0759-20121206/841_1 /TAXON_ID=63605 /ORGANISM="Percolomonas cosmopolitus, Strain WS" /LENGTH=400 /DNA_ID=CAMNT_0005227705 /DNA_START=120 /DNA_END=1322 /DNA_ORIENTATION=-